MRTKTTVTRSASRIASVTLTISWDQETIPPAEFEKIFAALGEALRTMMTDDEKAEFLDNLRAAVERAALRPPARKRNQP